MRWEGSQGYFVAESIEELMAYDNWLAELLERSKNKLDAFRERCARWAFACRNITGGLHHLSAGNGFSRGRETKRVKSEHDVFEHVGLPYKDPWER